METSKQQESKTGQLEQLLTNSNHDYLCYRQQLRQVSLLYQVTILKGEIENVVRETGL